MPIPISVFTITYNEENNIQRLLTSLSEFDEVIIVDSGSTDNTVAIAREMGAKVHSHNWMGYAKQKQHAMDLCKNDWVMNLDADEQIPESLVKELEQSINQVSFNAIRLLRIDYFLGKPMPTCLSLPKNVRLYRKSKAQFDSTCLVHESASISGKTKLVKTPFIHHGYNDLRVLINKLNIYSSLKAKEKFNKGKHFSYLKLVLIFPFEFIRRLVFQRYALFGWRGFLLSVIYANYAFLKEAKLYSLFRGEHHKNEKAK